MLLFFNFFHKIITNNFTMKNLIIHFTIYFIFLLSIMLYASAHVVIPTIKYLRRIHGILCQVLYDIFADFFKDFGNLPLILVYLIVVNILLNFNICI